MRKIFLLGFIFISFISFSQDTLIRTNGNRIVCTILNSDSLKVNFRVNKEGRETITSIRRTEVKELRYFTPTREEFKDTVIRTNGSRIECTILELDSSKVNFKIKKQGEELTYSIRQSEVKAVRFFNPPKEAFNDTIFMTDGSYVFCKIQFIDDAKIYFLTDGYMSTWLLRSEIRSFRYGSRKHLLLTRVDVLTLGFGTGFDFGGIGGNFTLFPQKYIGFFMGGGYNLVGFGYNTGIKLRYISAEASSHFIPFIVGMYGYNAVVKVENADDLNKVFYGPSFGGGFDLRFRPKKKTGYLSFSVLVPIRGSEVTNYMDLLKTKYGVTFKNDLPPINISIGYKIILY